MSAAVARPFAALLLVATLLVTALPARAVTLLRDADIEHALAMVAAPVLRGAGLSPSQVKVVMVRDDSLNAFIVDNSTIYIHSGLILKLDTPAQLQAVIAHEAAHITNGHIARRLGNMRNARTATLLGMALAAATGVSTGSGDAAAAIMMGSSASAMNKFMAHTRAEESAADITSIRSMVNAGLDPRGAVEVQEIFRGQELLSAPRQDPYVQTHPLTRDRLRALQGLVAASPGQGAAADPSTVYWFARARAKLAAFLRAPSWTLRRLERLPSKDIALMAEAVAQHRQSDLRRALRAIDGAIALRPNDPFLRDLKGEILLESRQAGPAVQVYGQARQLAPRNAQILAGLGRAQLAAGQYGAALRTLEEARDRDWRDNRVLRDLAVAYAKTGNTGMASEATAQRYALQGRLHDAGIHANRALGLLPRGSAPYRRAQDVADAAARAEKKR